jgi:phasin family protein
MSSDSKPPFPGMDFGAFDFSKVLGSLKLPGVDWQALLESQAKNIAALSAANHLAFEGMQAVARRQVEILQQTMTEAAELARQSTAIGTREALTRQSDVAKQAFEKAIANMHELADMVQKSNRQAVDVVNQRIAASLQEMKDHLQPK